MIVNEKIIQNTFSDISKDTEISITGVRDVCWNNDGTRLYVVPSGLDSVVEYRLTTPWDISTATSFFTLSLSSVTSDIHGIHFNADGSFLFVTDSLNHTLHRVTLVASWNLNSAGLVTSTVIGTASDRPVNVVYSEDGTTCYVLDVPAGGVTTHTLATPFLLSSSTGTTTTSLSQFSDISTAKVSTNGNYLLISAVFGEGVFYRATLSSKYDPTSVSTIETKTFNIDVNEYYGMAYDEYADVYLFADPNTSTVQQFTYKALNNEITNNAIITNETYG